MSRKSDEEAVIGFFFMLALLGVALFWPLLVLGEGWLGKTVTGLWWTALILFAIGKKRIAKAYLFIDDLVQARVDVKAETRDLAAERARRAETAPPPASPLPAPITFENFAPPQSAPVDLPPPSLSEATPAYADLPPPIEAAAYEGLPPPNLLPRRAADDRLYPLEGEQPNH